MGIFSKKKTNDYEDAFKGLNETTHAVDRLSLIHI